MYQVKSNFLHQSLLVPEGILFGTSQFVSEAHLCRNPSSTAIWFTKLKGAEEEGKGRISWRWHTSPGGSSWTMLVIPEAERESCEQGASWKASNDGVEIAQLRRLTENSQPCSIPCVTTSPVRLSLPLVIEADHWIYFFPVTFLLERVWSSELAHWRRNNQS